MTAAPSVSCRWRELPTGSALPRISYLECGEEAAGAIHLLLIHGSGMADFWRRYLPALAEKGCRCIAPNCPSFVTGWEAPGRDNDMQTDGIRNLITILGLRDVIIVAAGEECGTAMRLLEEAPGKNGVRGGVFLAGGGCGFERRPRSRPPGAPVAVLSPGGAIPEKDPSSPDEEMFSVIDGNPDDPAEVWRAVSGLIEKLPKTSEKSAASPTARPAWRRMRFHRLFDRMSLGALFVIFILRILHVVRRIRGRAVVPVTASGWRKLTEVFLGGEYSKFMLGAFRLAYAPAWGIPSDRDSAFSLLAGRFSDFLIRTPSLHWHVTPGRYSFGLSKSFFCDVVEARTDALGHLTGLVPHFDPRHPEWLGLKPEQLDIALDRIIAVCNRFRKLSGAQRPRRVAAELKKWVRSGRGLSRSERRSMQTIVERVLSAAFIFCEVPDDDSPEKRFAMPDMKRFRHPGGGMLCIAARFYDGFREADLWCQFNHAAADGSPMQEVLEKLKLQWGRAGELVYPALPGIISRPDRVYCGDGVFRCRVFADFRGLLRVRRELNQALRHQIGGSVSLAGLILWGLSRCPGFSGKKILLPVDTRSSDDPGGLGLMVIRPEIYREGTGEIADFIRFHRAMDKKLRNIRSGRSESGEFLELCTMLHPLVYRIAGFLMRRELQEIVGTVGVSIIRGAEMFVSPITQFQSNGFMTVGDMEIPTADGGAAGAVSLCGTKGQIRNFLEAVRYLCAVLPDEMARRLREYAAGNQTAPSKE